MRACSFPSTPWPAHEKWDNRVSELAFHNLEGNVSVISKRTDFQLEQARERVLTVARNIADGNFKPKPGFLLCNFCAFRGLCPAREKQAPKVATKIASTAGKSLRLTDEVPNTSPPKLPRKNLGDAFGVPFDFRTDFLNASFSSFAFFLVAIGFYSPFHFHGKNLQRCFVATK